jgi:hypothetical protein
MLAAGKVGAACSARAAAAEGLASGPRPSTLLLLCTSASTVAWRDDRRGILGDESAAMRRAVNGAGGFTTGTFTGTRVGGCAAGASADAFTAGARTQSITSR